MSIAPPNLIFPKIRGGKSFCAFKSVAGAGKGKKESRPFKAPEKSPLVKMRTHEPLLFNCREDLESVLGRSNHFSRFSTTVNQKQGFIFLESEARDRAAESKGESLAEAKQESGEEQLSGRGSDASKLTRLETFMTQQSKAFEARRESRFTDFSEGRAGQAPESGISSSAARQTRASAHSGFPVNFRIRFSEFACLRKKTLRGEQNQREKTNASKEGPRKSKFKLLQRRKRKTKAALRPHELTLKIFRQKFEELHSIRDRFSELREIGRGSYAVAFSAVETSTGREFVLKSFALDSFSKKSYLGRFLVGAARGLTEERSEDPGDAPLGARAAAAWSSLRPAARVHGAAESRQTDPEEFPQEVPRPDPGRVFDARSLFWKDSSPKYCKQWTLCTRAALSTETSSSAT